jgi:hypothetical protein
VDVQLPERFELVLILRQRNAAECQGRKSRGDGNHSTIAGVGEFGRRVTLIRRPKLADVSRDQKVSHNSRAASGHAEGAGVRREPHPLNPVSVVRLQHSHGGSVREDTVAGVPYSSSPLFEKHTSRIR